MKLISTLFIKSHHAFALMAPTRKGFTLIELLISLTLIFILSTIGIAGYRQSARKSAVAGVQNQVAGMLRQAQTNAQGGKKVACTGELSGWQVRFTSTTAILEEVCGASTFGSTTLTLPAQVTISSLPSPNPIIFRVLSKGTNAGSGLGITGFGISKGVTVSSGGGISMTDTIPPAPTPTPGPDLFAPVGSFDSINCSLIVGWTCDQDDFNQTLTVHIYKDGPYGAGGTFVGVGTANVTREAAVGSQCGGNVNHGFSISTFAGLKDGVSHPVYLYAINHPSAGNNPLLNGSPKSIQCP